MSALFPNQVIVSAHLTEKASLVGQYANTYVFKVASKATKLEIKKSKLNFHSLLKQKEVFVVDGNKFFNRPGPRLLESIKILCEIIHPDVFKPEPSLERWVSVNLSE